MKRVQISLLLVMMILLYQSVMPSGCLAFEVRKVILVGPLDSAQYQSEQINSLILDNWKQVFRYPYYEVIAEIRNSSKPLDQVLLQQLAKERQADIVVSTEIARLHSYTYSRGFWESETWQETELQLNIQTFNAANGQAQSFTVRRRQDEPLSVNTGVLPLMKDALEEVLRRVPYTRIPSDH